MALNRALNVLGVRFDLGCIDKIKIALNEDGIRYSI